MKMIYENPKMTMRTFKQELVETNGALANASMLSVNEKEVYNKISVNAGADTPSVVFKFTF